MQNLKEFNELIERYETITLKEIEKVWRQGRWEAKGGLTGFGISQRCTLCIAVMSGAHLVCSGCVYFSITDNFCFDEVNERSYTDIVMADTPVELHEAYRNRAKHMRKLLKNLTSCH